MINRRRAAIGGLITVLGGEVGLLQAITAASTIGTSPLIYLWTILFGLGVLGPGLFLSVRWVGTLLRRTVATGAIKRAKVLLVLGYLMGMASLIVIAIGADASLNRKNWYDSSLSALIPGGPPFVFGSGILSGALVFEGVWLLASSRTPTSASEH